MAQNTEAKALADVYKSVRSLTKFFVNQLQDIDIEKQFELDGIKLNTISWLIGHLCWTENALILKGVGNIDSGIPWLEEYGIGTNPSDIKMKPGLSELISTLDNIHEKALGVLENLNDEELSEDNYLGFGFGGDKSKRMLIIHAIRHEPMHTGQLSWSMKLNRAKTI